MSTDLPSLDAYPAEVVAWWDLLSDQERICHALRAYEQEGGYALHFSVALNPGAFAQEAYELRDVAWQEPREEGPCL